MEVVRRGFEELDIKLKRFKLTDEHGSSVLVETESLNMNCLSIVYVREVTRLGIRDGNICNLVFLHV